MNIWLLKTDPETYCWDDLEKEVTTVWDGVRNYQARNYLRRMIVDDIALIYHSILNPAIVGIAKIVKESYPDPTAEKGDWSVVDVQYVRKLKRSITLKEIKQDKDLESMILLRNSRLSVQPVTEPEYLRILKIENL